MRRRKKRTKKRRRRARGRCRLCRSNNGKRQCPALRALLICPDCCQELRGRINGCDQHCQFYAPLLTKSKKSPFKQIPVYKCLISKSRETGMIIAVLARERLDGSLKVMFVLLDLWKKGIRDCFVDAKVSKEELMSRCTKIAKHYHIATPPEAKDEKERDDKEKDQKKDEEKRKEEEFPFREVGFKRFQRLCKYAYRIANEVKTEIPWEIIYWADMFGDVSKVPEVGGSLYKCPKCGANLPDQVVGLMKQHAQSDDIQFYILCRKCGGQFE